MTITLTTEQKQKLKQIIDKASFASTSGGLYTFVDTFGNFVTKRSLKTSLKTIVIRKYKRSSGELDGATIKLDDQDPIYFDLAWNEIEQEPER